MASAIERVLSSLNDAGVRYVVVGGVAVVLHGHLRTTADLDLVVDLRPENARRAASALAASGYVPRAPVRGADLADAETRRRWIAEKDLRVLSFWCADTPLEVDVFVESPFGFEAVHRRALRVSLGGTSATVVALEDLIEQTARESPARRRGRPGPGGDSREAASRRLVTDAPAPPDDGFDHGWEGHWKRQVLRGLELTPAERLRWLEDTMEQMRAWLGRAQHGTPIGDDATRSRRGEPPPT